jgi:hypothetical protein
MDHAGEQRIPADPSSNGNSPSALRTVVYGCTRGNPQDMLLSAETTGLEALRRANDWSFILNLTKCRKDIEHGPKEIEDGSEEIDDRPMETRPNILPLTPFGNAGPTGELSLCGGF